MAISILNNPASLAAQNQLGITNSNLQKTLYQLSSGSRINSGADDAAGLAVADGLMANITALTQSARNASDGVGKLQVADGALAQVTTLLNRAITLATESANGTLSDTQRAPLQAEFASVKAEIDRIGATTNFNGQQVFQNTTVGTQTSGTSSLTLTSTLGGSAPVTYGATAGLSGATSTGGTASSWTTTIGGLADATALTADITFTLATPGTGVASGAITLNHLTDTNVGLLIADINNNHAGVLHAAYSGGNLVVTANAATITNAANDSVLQTAGAQATAAAGTVNTLTLGAGGNQYVYNTYGLGNATTMLAAINADGKYTASIPGSGTLAGQLKIGYGTVSPVSNTAGPTVSGMGGVFGAYTASGNALNGGAKTFTVQGWTAASATTFTDTGSLTVGTLISNLQSMGFTAALDTAGHLVIGDPSEPAATPGDRPTVGGTTTAFGTWSATTGGVAANTDIYLTDGSANVANTISVAIGLLSSSSMNGADLSTNDLSTQAAAKTALTTIQSAISNVAALRGTLGASVNRLQSATNVINNNIQNLTSAQDNIRAADIPATVASMAKYSILEQTGVAALSQANQMQQLVLKLIQ